MATLTTTGGAAIAFDPGAIDAIADHNDTTGAAATCVYGIPPSMLMVAHETVQGFMQRLGLEKDFAHLTRPNGWPVWIRASSVTAIRPPAPGEYRPEVKSVISTPSLTQAVREAPADATAAIHDHGGKL